MRGGRRFRYGDGARTEDQDGECGIGLGGEDEIYLYRDVGGGEVSLEVQEVQVSLSLGFECQFLCTALCNAECCIRHLWCSSIILYNITSTVYKHHTDLLSSKHKNTYIYLQLSFKPCEDTPLLMMRRLALQGPLYSAKLGNVGIGYVCDHLVMSESIPPRSSVYRNSEINVHCMHQYLASSVPRSAAPTKYVNMGYIIIYRVIPLCCCRRVPYLQVH